jgi:hypothetical protein
VVQASSLQPELLRFHPDTSGEPGVRLLWPSARAECAFYARCSQAGLDWPPRISVTTKPVKLNRNRILAALVLLMILWALPGAVRETLETGRVYLFSRQFLEDLPQRFSGPGRLRFILQPLVAILLGVRGGLADARSGQSPYIFALLFHTQKRKELLRSGMTAIGHVLALGILLDAVAQLLIYKVIHPGAALLIGPLLVGMPYAMSRALTGRLARWLKRKGSMAA